MGSQTCNGYESLWYHTYGSASWTGGFYGFLWTPDFGIWSIAVTCSLIRLVLLSLSLQTELVSLRLTFLIRFLPQALWEKPRQQIGLKLVGELSNSARRLRSTRESKRIQVWVSTIVHDSPGVLVGVSSGVCVESFQERDGVRIGGSHLQPSFSRVAVPRRNSSPSGERKLTGQWNCQTLHTADVDVFKTMRCAISFCIFERLLTSVHPGSSWFTCHHVVTSWHRDIVTSWRRVVRPGSTSCQTRADDASLPTCRVRFLRSRPSAALRARSCQTRHIQLYQNTKIPTCHIHCHWFIDLINYHTELQCMTIYTEYIYMLYIYIYRMYYIYMLHIYIYVLYIYTRVYIYIYNTHTHPVSGFIWSAFLVALRYQGETSVLRQCKVGTFRAEYGSFSWLYQVFEWRLSHAAWCQFPDFFVYPSQELSKWKASS